MAEPEVFEKTPKKAGRWFRAFIIFSLLYGMTFSLHAVFNWIFFFAATYSLFMSYFMLPVQPKIFGPRRPSGQRYNPNVGSTQVQTPAGRPRKVIIGVAAIIFGMFMIPFTIGLIEGFKDGAAGDDYQTTDDQASDDLTTTALVDIGHGFYNEQKYDSALLYYEKALSIDPNFGSAIYGKGIVAYSRGNIEEANRYFTISYEGGYRYAWLSWALADMYDKQGQTYRAIELYKESVSLDSSYVDSYNRLAELEPANSGKYLNLARKYADN